MLRACGNRFFQRPGQRRLPEPADPGGRNRFAHIYPLYHRVDRHLCPLPPGCRGSNPTDQVFFVIYMKTRATRSWAVNPNPDIFYRMENPGIPWRNSPWQSYAGEGVTRTSLFPACANGLVGVGSKAADFSLKWNGRTNIGFGWIEPDFTSRWH